MDSQARADAQLQQTGSISLNASIRCCSPGRRGMWLCLQDGTVELWSDIDGFQIVAYNAAEFANSISVAGSRMPKRPFWCAIHETEKGVLWLGMAAAGTSGMGILVGLVTESDSKNVSVKEVKLFTNHQKGAVRCITSYRDLLFTSSDENMVVVRNASSGKALALLEGHESYVVSMKVVRSSISDSVEDSGATEAKCKEVLWTGASDGLRIWDFSDISPETPSDKSKDCVMDTACTSTVRDRPKISQHGSARVATRNKKSRSSLHKRAATISVGDGRLKFSKYLTMSSRARTSKTLPRQSLRHKKENLRRLNAVSTPSRAILKRRNIKHRLGQARGILCLDIMDNGLIVVGAGDGCLYIYHQDSSSEIQKISLFRRTLGIVCTSMGFIWAAASTGALKMIELSKKEDPSDSTCEVGKQHLVRVPGKIVSLVFLNDRIWVGTKNPTGLLAFGGSKLKNTKRRKQSIRLNSNMISLSRRASSSANKLPKAKILDSSSTSAGTSASNTSSPLSSSEAPSKIARLRRLRSAPDFHGRVSTRESSPSVKSSRNNSSQNGANSGTQSGIPTSSRSIAPTRKLSEVSPDHIALVRSRAKNVTYQKQVGKLEEKLSKMEQDFKVRLQTANAQATAASNNHKSALKKVNELSSRVKRLEHESKDARTRLVEKETDIIQMNSELAKLREEKKRANDQLLLVHRHNTKRTDRELRVHDQERKKAEMLLQEARKEFEKELGKKERRYQLRVDQLEQEKKDLRNQTARFHQQMALKNQEQQGQSASDEELSQLRKSKERLQRQLKEQEEALAAEINLQKERLSRWEEKYATLRKELTRCHSENKEKIDSIRKASRTEVENLLAESKKEQENLSVRLKDERARARVESDKLQLELSTLRKRLKDEKTNLSNQLRSNQGAAEKERKQLEAQFAQEKLKLKQIHKVDIEALQKENDDELAKKNEQLKASEHFVKQLTTKKQEMLKDLEKTMHRLAAESEKSSLAEKERLKDCQRLQEVKKKLTELERQHTELKLKKDEEEKLRVLSEKRLEQYARDAVNVQQEFVNRQDLISKLTESVGHYRQEAENDKEKIDELMQEVSYSKEKLSYTKRSLEAKENSIRQLASEHDALREANSELEENLRDLKATHEEEVEGLRSQLETWRNKHLEQARLVDIKDKERRRTREMHQDLVEEKLDELQDKIRQKDELIESFKKELAQLKSSEASQTGGVEEKIRLKDELIGSLRRELSDLSSKTKEEIEKLQKELAKRNGMIKKFMSHVKKEDEKLKKAMNAEKAAREKADHLTKQLVEKMDVHSNDQPSGDVSRIIDEAHRERDQARERIRELELDAKNMKIFIRHLDDEKKRAENKVKSLQTQLSKPRLGSPIPNTPNSQNGYSSPVPPSPLRSPIPATPSSQLSSPVSGELVKAKAEAERFKKLTRGFMDLVNKLKAKLAKKEAECKQLQMETKQRS